MRKVAFPDIVTAPFFAGSLSFNFLSLYLNTGLNSPPSDFKLFPVDIAKKEQYK
jgi:hypothetical protein